VVGVRSLVSASAALLLTLGACAGGAASSSPMETAPTGLADDHLLIAIDYVIDDPVFDGVYDPRGISLTADGRLLLVWRDRDAMFDTRVTRLDAAGLDRAWSAIIDSGVFIDGDLPLPGFPEAGGTATADVFQVDDGTRSTRLVIASLGSEGLTGRPPIPAGEMALRTAATQLMVDLRGMGGGIEQWTPPALLLWWRPELPADTGSPIVPWSLPIDLASAGHPIEHPVWERCVRLEGGGAAAVAEFAGSLPIDHRVELDDVRYAIVVRAIHPEELSNVACPLG
jgi:hypothetical protein